MNSCNCRPTFQLPDEH